VELESGKLALSSRMAEKISAHTGINKAWLQAGNSRATPVCERDPQRPFTKEVFERSRAEVLDPRCEAGELAVVNGAVNGFCAQLRAIGSEAYRTNEVIYFNFKVREFLQGLQKRWNTPNQLGLTEGEFWQALQACAKQTAKTDPPRN
jgi:hypothetical protein